MNPLSFFTRISLEEAQAFTPQKWAETLGIRVSGMYDNLSSDGGTFRLKERDPTRGYSERVAAEVYVRGHHVHVLTPSMQQLLHLTIERDRTTYAFQTGYTVIVDERGVEFANARYGYLCLEKLCLKLRYSDSLRQDTVPLIFPGRDLLVRSGQPIPVLTGVSDLAREPHDTLVNRLWLVYHELDIPVVLTSETPYIKILL